MAIAGLAPALAVATALRLPGLGTWSLWVDEMATAAFVSLSWQDLVGPLARMETTPPPYYLFIKAWTSAAGASDAALRLPSALAGIASVAAVWALCRDAVGHRAAFWAAMILAVTGSHLFHSRDARVYALLTLVMLLGLLAGRAFATRAARPGTGWVTPGIGLALLAATAPWLHFTGVIVAAMVFGHVIALLVGRGAFDRRATARLAAALALWAALTLPAVLLAASVAAAGGADGVGWLHALGMDFAVASMARVLLLAPWTVDPWPLMGPACAGAAALVWILLAWRAARPGPQGAERAALFATLLGGITLFLLAQAFAPVVLPRTLQVLVPLVAAVLGVGLARIPSRPARVLVFATFVASQAPSLNDIFNAPPDGSDWRGLSARLAEDAGAGGSVVALDVFDALALARYRAAGAPDAALLVLPPYNATMQAFVAARLLPAPAVRPADLVATLCDAAIPVTRLIVIERLSPVLGQLDRTLRAALGASGAQPGDARGGRSLHLRAWTAPTCPPRPASARP